MNKFLKSLSFHCLFTCGNRNEMIEGEIIHWQEKLIHTNNVKDTRASCLKNNGPFTLNYKSALILSFLKTNTSPFFKYIFQLFFHVYGMPKYQYSYDSVTCLTFAQIKAN